MDRQLTLDEAIEILSSLVLEQQSERFEAQMRALAQPYRRDASINDTVVDTGPWL